MDFNEVIDRRKTSREWTDREVAYDTIKKILEAGMKAPSWDHYRNWQFTMLVDCPYVIVPLFKCARLNGEWVSKLNPLTTAWCVAENIMLAAINEGLGYSLRIPLNREHDVVLQELGVPQGWMTPCFIGIGYPKEDETVPEQYSTSPEGHIHLGGW